MAEEFKHEPKIIDLIPGENHSGYHIQETMLQFTGLIQWVVISNANCGKIIAGYDSKQAARDKIKELIS